jgi:uncharacterized zinc-type alcohol dehydrogenase-like protein
MGYKTKAFAAYEKAGDLKAFAFERRALRPADIVIKVSYAGICHSDIHTVAGEWGEVLTPLVPGHEVVGTVTEIGTSVSKFEIGNLVGVGVFIDSCRECINCKKGLQQYCVNGMTGTYNGYERDGVTPAQGGYSDTFVVNQDYAVHVSDKLAIEGVAPLMCAGITLYSPLRHWGAGPGKKVAVIGLGGLGHMGVKFASAMGAEVTVFSHSLNKKDDAIRMGATNFVLTKDLSVFENLRNTFDLILNTVSADIDLHPYLKSLTLDGTMVMIGLPGKPYTLDASILLPARRSIAGSMIGGIPELQEMLDFCAENGITSDVEVIPAAQINEAYKRTVASDVKYRFVIDAKTF